MNMLAFAINTAERTPIPDGISLAAIDLLCSRMKRRLLSTTNEAEQAFVDEMDRFPVATHTVEANRQHYEVPAEFFAQVLGPQRKYSCCLYPDATTSLAEAEALALAETVKHAEIEDGMEILELGCGWGSLSLHLALKFPKARILSVSNSASQRSHILSVANMHGISNLDVITADMNEFETDERFDRGMKAFVLEVRRVVRRGDQEPVEAGDAEQAQAHDEHAGDRAAAKRDGERFVEAGARRFGGAHVRPHRDVHADVAGKAREHRADGEPARGTPRQEHADQHEEDYADDADRRVLAVEVRLRAGLDCRGDFLHSRIARRFGEDPADGDRAINDRRNRADEREDERIGHENTPCSNVIVVKRLSRRRSCGRPGEPTALPPSEACLSPGGAAVPWNFADGPLGGAAAKTRYFASLRART